MSSIKLRKSLIFLFFSLILGSGAMRAESENPDVFRPYANRFAAGFDYGHLSQAGYPALKSDFGFSLLTAKTYYLWRPAAGRFQLGVEVAWCDVNYYNYKICYNTLEGSQFSYVIHTGDVGMQVGLGLNLNISRDICLHLHGCYNPSFAGIYQEQNFSCAFGNYGTAGLTLSWKHIGVGVDIRFGPAKFKHIDLLEFDDEDSAGSILQRPGIVAEESMIKFEMVSIRSSLVFYF